MGYGLRAGKVGARTRGCIELRNWPKVRAMWIVGRDGGRAWGVGVAVLAIGIVVSWWLLRDDAGESAPRETAAHDAGLGAAPALPMLAPPGSRVIGSDRIPEATELRLLVATPAGNLVCTVSGPADGLPLRAASCRASADAEEEAAFGRDGDGIAAPVGEASAVRMGDHDVWIEPEGEAATLLARTANGTGAPVRVGAIGATSERIHGCVSSEGLALAVDSVLVHDVNRLFVAFRHGGGWTDPVAAEASVFDYRMTCRGRETALSWIEPGEESRETRRVVQIRCTPDGCERTEGRATFTGSDPLVADLAGKALLVWADRDATHARLAPLVELDTAADLSPLPQPDAPVLARHLFVRGATAVLVYRTRDGLFAVRIDAAGRATPLSVREPGALSAP